MRIESFLHVYSNVQIFYFLFFFSLIFIFQVNVAETSDEIAGKER